MKHFHRALNYHRRRGLLFAWLMARASYEHSRAHGLARPESIAGALRLFRTSLQR